MRCASLTDRRSAGATRLPARHIKLIGFASFVAILGVGGTGLSQAAPIKAGDNYLSDLNWVSARNSLGPVELDKSNGTARPNDGPPIVLNGTTYAKGLGVHSNAQIVYDLAGQCSSFSASVGINDFRTAGVAIGSRGSMVFRVLVDGVKKYDSGILRGDTPTANINLTITGAKQLRLVTTGGRDGGRFDHGVWADAKVNCGTGTGGGGGGGGGTTSQKDAARLMLQASYGPTLAGIDAIAAQGAAAWIDAQLNIPYSNSHHAYLAARKAANKDDDHMGIMQESIWGQGIKGADQLRQRVAFAWSEIFVVSAYRIFDANGIAAYMDVLSRDAFANYRTLLESVTLNQAMGIYLDMLRSDKEDPATGRVPNENYAREVLQLFSIGLDELNQDGTAKLDANGKAIPTYDQDVVLGFAKAFSGWSYGSSPLTNDGFFYPIYPNPANFWQQPMKAFPEHHSTATKLLLRGFTLSAGQTAEKDLKDALDNIFNHPNVGPFIGKQLIQRLVTSNPTPAYVSRVAAVFNNNGSGVRGDMKAVIKAILMDTEARDPTLAKGDRYGKQKEPVLRVGNLVRAFDGSSTSGLFGFWSLEYQDYGVGQAHFRSPSVFNFFKPGYAPQGPIADAKLVAPEFEITTDTQIIASSNILKYLIYYGYGALDSNKVKLNFSNVASLASDPAKLVDTLDLLMTGGNLSALTRTAVIAAVSAYPATSLTERAQAAAYLLTVSPDFVVQK